jgi:hypothetical protein
MRGLPGFADDVAAMTRVRAKLPSGFLMMLAFGVASSRAQNSIHPQAPACEVIRR